MFRSRLAPASVRRRLRGLGSPAALGRPLTGTPSLGRDLAIVDPLLVARLVAEALLSRLHRSGPGGAGDRSEEHTSELQSLMRTSYAVFCLKKKTTTRRTLFA